MTDLSKLRVLFFDVFGTCVAQRTPVADELSRAAREALQSGGPSIDSEVRTRAVETSYEQWFDFGGEWNSEIDKLTKRDIEHNGNVQWRTVDKYRLDTLCKLLAERGLILPPEDADNPELHAKQGSLWGDSQLKHLSLVWHRLTPWPDTCPGLDLLNKKFVTVTLSNSYNELLDSLVSRGNIPFKHIYSSDMFQSYKPNPKVYLGAAEKMDVQPEECGLVAAHLSDLKGAKACGFTAIYVERPLEEKTPHLREEDIPDILIKEDEDGFFTVAERLGIQRD